MTILEAFERLAATGRWRPGTVSRYRRSLEQLAASRIALLRDVKPSNVAAYFNDRVACVAPATARTDGAILAIVLQHFVDLELFSLDELARVRRLTPYVRRPRALCARFLVPREVDSIVAAARTIAPRLVFPFRVGVLTGLRVSELGRLRWDQFELGARPCLRVTEAPEWGKHGALKTGPRVVPVCRELLALVVSEREGTVSPFCFPSMPDLRGISRFPFMTGHDCLRRFLRRAAREAAIPRPSWNLVRHTRASTWLAAGVPPAKVAKWLGNTLDTMARYYAGLVEGYDPDCERMPA